MSLNGIIINIEGVKSLIEIINSSKVKINLNDDLFGPFISLNYIFIESGIELSKLIDNLIRMKNCHGSITVKIKGCTKEDIEKGLLKLVKQISSDIFIFFSFYIPPGLTINPNIINQLKRFEKCYSLEIWSGYMQSFSFLTSINNATRQTKRKHWEAEGNQ